MTDAATGRRRATAALVAAGVLNAAVLLTPDVGGRGLLDLPGADKAVHVALFVLLAAAVRWRFGPPRISVVVLVAYAALTELAQSWWLAGRGGDARDLAADGVGIALGWVAARAWRPVALGSVAATIRPEQVVR